MLGNFNLFETVTLYDRNERIRGRGEGRECKYTQEGDRKLDIDIAYAKLRRSDLADKNSAAGKENTYNDAYPPYRKLAPVIKQRRFPMAITYCTRKHSLRDNK